MISDRVYAVLGSLPITQQIVGLGSVIKNLSLLAKDAFLEMFGPGNDKCDEDIKEILGKLKELKTPKGYDRHPDATKLELDLERIESLRVEAGKHFEDLVNGIKTATPILGTAYNWTQLKEINKNESKRPKFW